MFKFPFYTDNPDSLKWDEITSEFSWVKDMIGVEQDPVWHAEGNVNIHTKMVTKALLKLPEFHLETEQDRHILFATALFHDIEKRSTTIREWNSDENRECVAAPKHAKKGEYTTREILFKQFNCPFEVREKICKLVRWHGVPLWAMDKSNPVKTVIESSLHVKNRWLGMFSKADALGRKCNDLENLLTRIEIFEEICKENNVWDSPYNFKSDLERFTYFYNEDAIYPNYDPFDDFKGQITIMCGLPGAGKSKYINDNFKGENIISMDEIRRSRKIKRGDKKKEGQMIQEVKEMAKSFLRSNESFVWDATCITKKDRAKLIDLAMDYKFKSKIIYVEPSYKTILKQNSNREHKVPERVINRYLKALEIPSSTEACSVEYVTTNIY